MRPIASPPAVRVVPGVPAVQLVLVGHDWGGVICWAAAHTAQQLLSRLVVMCAPHSQCYLPNMDWDQFKRSWWVGGSGGRLVVCAVRCSALQCPAVLWAAVMDWEQAKRSWWGS